MQAFIDESEPLGKYYLLGALKVYTENVDEMTEHLDDFVKRESQKFGYFSSDAELHGYDIMNQKRDWKNTPQRARHYMYEEALKIIASYQDKCFYTLEGIDIEKHVAKYTTPFPPRQVAIQHCLERINKWAGYKNRVNVQLIADEHHTAETSRIDLIRYRDEGMYNASPKALSRINPDFIFMDSREHRLLQASDMITYIYQRRAHHVDKNQRANELKNRLWRVVSPKVVKNCRIWPAS